MKTVLLLSHSEDTYNIDRVAAALRRKSVNSIRLNTDRFPEGIFINEQVGPNGWEVLVKTEGAAFSSQEIGAVWLRKIWKPIIKSPMEPQFMNASINESIAVRTAFFQSLESLPWLDPIPAVTRASDKFLQLRSAQAAGLPIPQTLISNDAAAVKSFFHTLETGMITKLHTPLSYGMQTDDFFLYTTEIKAADLDALDMLDICPMIFQELIPKAYELRIAYVDGQCFTGKIQTAEVMDWRQADPTVVVWENYDLPPAIQQQLKQVMQHLGLSFGAIDLIRQSDGKYIFLEVNPLGEWGMLESDLNLPISDAIAQVLIKRMT